MRSARATKDPAPRAAHRFEGDTQRGRTSNNRCDVMGGDRGPAVVLARRPAGFEADPDLRLVLVGRLRRWSPSPPFKRRRRWLPRLPMWEHPASAPCAPRRTLHRRAAGSDEGAADGFLLRRFHRRPAFWPRPLLVVGRIKGEAPGLGPGHSAWARPTCSSTWGRSHRSLETVARSDGRGHERHHGGGAARPSVF